MFMMAKTFALRARKAAATAPASTWNSLDKFNTTLTNFDKQAKGTANSFNSVRGTLAATGSVKSYLEFYIDAASGTSGFPMLGIATSGQSLSSGASPGDDNSLGSTYYAGGTIRAGTGANNQSVSSWGTPGDVIGMAVDRANHIVYFRVNGTWQNSANPTAGTGGANYVTTSDVFPWFQSSNNLPQVSINTGGSAFTYAAPSGFSAWG